MLTKNQRIGVLILLGALFIFFLDMTPIHGAADGAGYALVIALAGYVGKREVVAAAVLGAVLTITADVLGAEASQTMLQIVSGRLMGLTVIILVAGAVLHLQKIVAATTASERESATYQKALSDIAQQALLSDLSLRQRFAFITETSAKAMGVDGAAVAFHAKAGLVHRVYDYWDARSGTHREMPDEPVRTEPQTRAQLQEQHYVAADDLTQSPIFADGRVYFGNPAIRALLHAAAIYHGKPFGSLTVACERPHHWTDREISFARSVSHLVALVFAIHRSEQMLQRLDHVGQAIFVQAPDGGLEYANLAARALTDDADLPAELPFQLPLLNGEADEQYLRYQGRELEVHRQRLPQDGIIIRIDDVTEHNAAKAETRKMQAQLEQSAKLHAIGQLAAGVAHDFNNILTAIMGFAQLLTRKLDDRSAEHGVAGRILGVCDKGKGITGEILAFARAGSVDREEVDLALVLAASLDMIPADETGSSVLSVAPSQEHLQVQGNAAQLGQLIQNLVVNARHACEGRDGIISLTARRAGEDDLSAVGSLSANERMLGAFRPQQEYCLVRVSDNGEGIAPAILDRIFEPFFTTKERRNGSGLGLAVVLGVVDSHGGFLHVRSDVGKGTDFTIFLPRMGSGAAATESNDATVVAA